MKFVILPPPIYVDSLEKIQDCLHICSKESVVAIDTETLGFKYGVLDDQALYMGISPNSQTRFFVPRHFMHYMKPLLVSNTIKVFHNYKFDAHRIENTIGIKVAGPIADTAIFHALIDSESAHSLDFLSDSIYKIPMAKYKRIMKHHNPRDVKPGHEIWDKFLDYGTLDALITRKLYNDLGEKLSKIKATKTKSMLDFYWKYEEPQLLALYDMERTGIRLDIPKLQSWHDESTKTIQKIRGKISAKINRPMFNKDGSEFNPNSNKQCAKLLYSELGLPVIKRTPSGAPSADEETLEELSKVNDNEVLKMIVEYRKVVKLTSTYSTNYLKLNKDGRIHTSYNPVGTATGRLSCSEPNLQNVPPIVRELFIPDEGYVFIGADYSQLELRLIAHLSQEPTMLSAFREGLDVHILNVCKMNDLEYSETFSKYKQGDPWIKDARSGVKAVVYGLSYGGQANRTSISMSQAYGREVSKNEAQKMLDKYFEANTKVKAMMRRMISAAKRNGFAKTMCGRRRQMPHITSSDWGLRTASERAALNAPIQGTAADITKCALINCWKSEELKSLGVQILLQIHDELIFQVPIENAELAKESIRQIMEDPFEGTYLTVALPAQPDIGLRWSDLK